MDSNRRNAIHTAMVRFSDGDRSAFDVLESELWPVILSFAERGVGGVTDAEDVAQEVFLRICYRISDFDRTRDGLSWAFGIATFEIMTHRRRQYRRREVCDDSAIVAVFDGAPSQEDAMIDREVILALEQAVGALTDDDRRALGLLDHHDDQEAGPRSPTLRKRKQRAVDRLRDLWRSIYGEP